MSSVLDTLFGDPADVPLAVSIVGFLSAFWLVVRGATWVYCHLARHKHEPDWRDQVVSGIAWGSYGFALAWVHGVLAGPALVVAASCFVDAGQTRQWQKTRPSPELQGMWASVVTAAAAISAVGYKNADAEVDHGLVDWRRLNAEQWEKGQADLTKRTSVHDTPETPSKENP